MDIYVVANLLHLHTVKCLHIKTKAGVTLDPGAGQVGMMRARDPRTLGGLPTISLTAERGQGEVFSMGRDPSPIRSGLCLGPIPLCPEVTLCLRQFSL